MKKSYITLNKTRSLQIEDQNNDKWSELWAADKAFKHVGELIFSRDCLYSSPERVESEK